MKLYWSNTQLLLETTVLGGWVGGWPDQMEIRLTLALVWVELKLSLVEAELGKIRHLLASHKGEEWTRFEETTWIFLTEWPSWWTLAICLSEGAKFFFLEKNLFGSKKIVDQQNWVKRIPVQKFVCGKPFRGVTKFCWVKKMGKINF